MTIVAASQQNYPKYMQNYPN